VSTCRTALTADLMDRAQYQALGLDVRQEDKVGACRQRRGQRRVAEPLEYPAEKYF
jgi:hypothetical protein